MIQVITKITVHGKSASQIANWLLNLNQERYLQWHPEHKDYRVIQLSEDIVGSVYYFDEIIDGFRINYEWKVVESRNNKLLLTKARIRYPIFLSISLKEIDRDTEVTHDMRIGFVYRGLEKAIDWLVRQFLFTHHTAKSIERHAREEFKNLEWLIK